MKLQVFLLFTLASTLSCTKINESRLIREQADATREALTEQNYQEVSSAIERFVIGWNSQELHQDPSEMSKYATGEYLDYWQNRRYQAEDIESWLRVNPTGVKSFLIYNYSSQRFKTVASVNAIIYREHYKQNISTCAFYVFFREDNEWKVAAAMPLDSIWDRNLRDWHYLPEWEKVILGELPEFRDFVKVCRDEN